MFRTLTRFCENLGEIAEREPMVRRTFHPEGAGVEVEFPGPAPDIHIMLPDHGNCVVADKLGPGGSDATIEVLDEVSRLGSRLQAGSVLIADGQEEVPDFVWEKADYDRQYYLPLWAAEEVGRADFNSLIGERNFEKFASYMEKHLNLPVEVERYLDERPYVLSFDFHGPSSEGEEPDFHFYLHLFELTGSAYIEKIELPKDKRRRGHGSRFVDYLKWLLTRHSFSYVYLEAADTATGFWERQGFSYLHRLNLRKHRRRRRAMRRRPGWERSWIGEYRLERPFWQYKMHPQDDIDFITGLLVQERAWDQLDSIAG